MTSLTDPSPAPRRAALKKSSSHADQECILVLQGGGALGAYQAGVFEALSTVYREPTWVAGISIGAINSALIAGNPANKRVERLREEDAADIDSIAVGKPEIEEHQVG